MEFLTAIRYLSYQAFSRHKKGYGVHSPFVFELVTHAFRNKIEGDIVNKIESLRRKMLRDKRKIEVTDLGSGSSGMNDTERRICDIVRFSSVPGKYGVFLARMARSFGKPLILELGTSLGISTMYLAASCPEVPVYTMEGCAAISGRSRECPANDRIF
jgi:hypothetical protein